ncbi:precorrin-2 dehydrogenase/sirohydrochlorin ferrochelatase family protein [Sulfurimonas sp.]
MGYFPAFLKLDNKKILLVGGGNVAYEKLIHLLDFSKNIDILSKNFSDEMRYKIDEMNLKYEQRTYLKGDISEYAIVVIAIDDITLQSEIFEESKNYKCLCNAVDSVDYCDFIFPSYIKEGALTIAVSTSGTSPAMAKHLRRYLQNLIPQNINDFLQEMKELRKSLPKGKKRMKMLDEKAKRYIQDWSK